MDGLSGKHFRLCNSVSFVAVLVKGLQSQFGCARLVILCGFGSFSVIVFCFVFLFMYFSFSSELLFDSIGYGSLPACLPAWLFPLPACMTVSTACLPALGPSACYLTWLLPLGSMHSSLSLAPPVYWPLDQLQALLYPPFLQASLSRLPGRAASSRILCGVHRWWATLSMRSCLLVSPRLCPPWAFTCKLLSGCWRSRPFR